MSEGLSSTHPTEEQIRAQLKRVLTSPEFRSSKRCQDFLQYVVDHTLRGHAGTLKERTIGMEVFARPASYDPSEDATVRVKAGEVRKRLGLYYSDQGAHDSLRIELPSGTYVPEFHAAVPKPAIPVAPPPEPAVAAPVRPRLRPFLMVGVPVAMALAFLFWSQTRPANTVLDQFWAPVLDGRSPVQICAAFVPVWNF